MTFTETTRQREQLGFFFQIIKGDHHAEERIFDGGFWKSRYNVGERGVQVTFDEQSTIKSFSFKIPGNIIS